MRAVKIAMVLLFTALLINWMHGRGETPIVQMLPFLGGRGRPALFEVAGLVMILTALWGFARLRQGERPGSGTPPLAPDESWDVDQDDEG